MPVDVKMAVLGKPDCEVEVRVNKLNLNMRVSGGMVGWNLENSQFTIVERKSLNSLCLELDSLSYTEKLINSSEQKCVHLLPFVEDSNSYGSQPSVVIGSGIWNKESIHLELIIAEEVEDAVMQSLESVAEQVSFW